MRDDFFSCCTKKRLTKKGLYKNKGRQKCSPQNLLTVLTCDVCTVEPPVATTSRKRLPVVSDQSPKILKEALASDISRTHRDHFQS